MHKKAFFILLLLGWVSIVSAQRSQLQLARNAVGKLQASVAAKEDKNKQKAIVKEGLKAVDAAKQHKKTKKYGETWAIKAYLSAYAALLADNNEEAEKLISVASATLDTATMLDKEQVTFNLLKAAQNNINIKRLEKGNRAFSDKDFFESFRIFKNLSDVYAKDTTLALNVAISALYIQRNEEAFKYFKRAADNKITNPSVYQHLARLYAANQDPDLAIKMLETGISLNPASNALKNDYINILLDNNRNEKALAAIEVALKITQDNERLFFLYGYLHQAQHNTSRAEAAYKRAIVLNNNYFDAFYQLGLLYIDRANSLTEPGKITNAQSDAEFVLQRAYDIKPNDINSLKLLIALNKKRNRPERAAELERRLNEL